jgi:hypothetical protein
MIDELEIFQRKHSCPIQNIIPAYPGHTEENQENPKPVFWLRFKLNTSPKPVSFTSRSAYLM